MSVTGARASTLDRWRAWSPRWRRRAPWCHSGGQAPGWGTGETWRAGVADVEGTELQERGTTLCTCPLGMKGGSGVRDTPLLPPRRSPLTPGSCWLWSGWPSSGRPSCLHGSCAGGYTHVPAPCSGLRSGPGDPSPRSLSSGSGPHCPRSLPSPPLDSSDSRQGIKTSVSTRSSEYQPGV